jgi:mutator protein MutT
MEGTQRTENVQTVAGSEELDVAAALVFRDGKLLIARRPAEAHLGGFWEFPGGKREPGETFQGCLKRELLEELGIEVTIGELLETVTHRYADRTVHLKFFRCSWHTYEPQAIGCCEFKWVAADELQPGDFPEPDRALLERLKSEPELWRE